MLIYHTIWNMIVNVRYLFINRRRGQKWAVGKLKEIELNLEGRFDVFTFKKITESYSVFAPLVFDSFTALRGRSSSLKEKEKLLHYFICSSLFDNFCDDDALSSAELYQISFFSKDYPCTSFDERTFLLSNTFLRNNVSDLQQYDMICKAMYDAQISSARQFDCKIGEEEIRNITLQKGGYAVMLCAFYLDDIACEAEQRCWYRIGEIIQLTDDLFDIYNDCSDGIYTLPNRMRDAYAFRKFYAEQVEAVKIQIGQLPFRFKSKQKLIDSIIGICSLGLVAISQIQNIQGSNRLLPDLKTLPRERLVVDMQKIKNQWRCIRSYMRLHSTIPVKKE